MRIEYDDDYNILELHKEVISHFQQQLQSVGKIQESISKLQIQHDSSKNPLDKKQLLAEINSLGDKLTLIESKQEYNQYMDRAKKILLEYKNIKTQLGAKIYGQEQVVSPEQKTRRKELVDSYMRIVEDYIDIEICHKPIVIPQICHNCGSDDLETGDGLRICNVCQTTREVYTKDSYYNSGKKVNMVTKGNYEDRDNFHKAIKRFQGKQPNKLPQDLFYKLDEYFSSYKLPTCNEVKSRPLSERKGGKLNKDTMYTALSRINYSGFYEDINLICHLAWGWELPDISHLEEQLMQDYDESQKIYNEIKEGHSSPNVQYRLYRHLQRLGYPCKDTDFKMIKTEEILVDYEDRWKQICQRLGWQYVRLNI